MRTPVAYFLILSGVLFSIGTVGVLVRRNALGAGADGPEQPCAPSRPYRVKACVPALEP